MTHSVRTIMEFITALRSISDNDIIEVMGDLDYNDTQDRSMVLIPEPSEDEPSPSASNVIINGNGHAIYNLTPPDNQSTLFRVMTANTDIHVNNLSFLNCNFGGRTGKWIWYSPSNSNKIFFRGGVITGKFAGSIANSCEFDTYMITAQYSSGSLSYSCSLRNCWIKLVHHDLTDNSTACLCRGMDTCYVTGSCIIATTIHNPQVFRQASNCCFNINCVLDAPESSLNTFILATNDGLINVVNTSIITEDGVAVPWESGTINKVVNTEQMKDAEYLANLGFNIIP